ncbi:ABC transporter ATP-binding protein [Amycolatopsis stemonae]
MDEAAIEVAGLRVRRGGQEVLRDIGFTVRRGTVTGLLGPNGCGKSTLMRSIAGVQIVESGRVHVLGRPAGSPDLRHRIGYATREPAIYADLTVTEALLGTPDLLVLDEPTVGSDPRLRDELWRLFHDLAETGVTLLISSHVLARGTPDTLRARTGAADLEQAFLRLIKTGEERLMTMPIAILEVTVPLAKAEAGGQVEIPVTTN